MEFDLEDAQSVQEWIRERPAAHAALLGALALLPLWGRWRERLAALAFAPPIPAEAPSSTSGRGSASAHRAGLP